METYFDVQCLEANSGEVLDIESYIRFRRDASGCKPSFALIEYANGLNLPDKVFEDPIICTLQEIANDIVSWSNVGFSSRPACPVPDHPDACILNRTLSRTISNSLAGRLGIWSSFLWNSVGWEFKKPWTMSRSGVRSLSIASKKIRDSSLPSGRTWTPSSPFTSKVCNIGSPASLIGVSKRRGISGKKHQTFKFTGSSSFLDVPHGRGAGAGLKNKLFSSTFIHFSLRSYPSNS